MTVRAEGGRCPRAGPKQDEKRGQFEPMGLPWIGTVPSIQETAVQMLAAHAHEVPYDV